MIRKQKLFLTAGMVLLVSAFTGIFPNAQAASVEGKRGLLELGAQAPDFHLTDVVSGKTVSRDDFSDQKGLLVMFLCRHCPYVQHVKKGVADLGRDYVDQEIGLVAVSANDPNGFPMDAPEKLKEMAVEEGFSFPFLFDKTQAAAKAYTAVATPDFFLFDENRKLVYRGQFDDSRPGNGKPVTGKDLREAMEALLAGREISKSQKPSFGCSIKWTPGNEPAYAG